MNLLRRITATVVCVFALNTSAQGETPPVFQPEPRPLPASMQIEDGLRLEYFHTALTQGGVGLLRLSGEDIVGARAEFRQKHIPFFQVAGDAFYALIAADMNMSPRTYSLIVHVSRESDIVRFERELRIDSANFIVQELKLPRGRAHLADAEIERNELDMLAALASEYYPQPLWDESGFELPHISELTTPFGAFRRLDEGRQSRHTGWDQNLPIGTPVHAMAAGVTRFAGPLDIRGNYVLIDHGLGLFSGYAHFSALHVVEGQRVEAGQIIGLSGNTGRSSAPHLHWEILLQGEWVDGLTLLEQWLPAPSGLENEAEARQ